MLQVRTTLLDNFKIYENTIDTNNYGEAIAMLGVVFRDLDTEFGFLRGNIHLHQDYWYYEDHDRNLWIRCMIDGLY